MRKRRAEDIPAYDNADIAAVKAVQAGRATEHQQQRAFQWILDHACDFRNDPYRRDNEGGERETSFNLGRHAVARHILYLATMPAELIEKAKKARRGESNG